MHLFFIACWALAVLVALLPLVFFLVFGWQAREAEFIDKVRDQTQMHIYFEKFWSEGQKKYGKKYSDACDLFRERYRHLVSLYYYIAPTLLFILVVAVLTGLVVSTAIRTGYDHYIGYYASEAKTEAEAAKAGVIGNPITGDSLKRTALADLDRDFAPLPPIYLSLSALSAVAGAYLFMVAQLIQQCRARTLVYSDLFGASLRLLVAVPLGLSLSTLASDALGPFISFGLGAFPIVELRTLIRRLTTTSLKAGDPRADDDQTVGMVGVTQSVSDTLADENITCAQQLADIDPVVLAVRTGLSFEYVLFLAAQSLVWCFLGKTASELGPLGLADARAIWYLIQKSEDDQKQVLDALDAHFAAIATTQAPKSIDAVLLREAFEKIAIDPYTIFLVHFTSDRQKPKGDAPELQRAA